MSGLSQSATAASQGLLHSWYLSLVKGLLGPQTPVVMSLNLIYYLLPFKRGIDIEGPTLCNQLVKIPSSVFPQLTWS